MTTKDVELRIKAKDAASANVKKISDALKLLSGEASDAAKGSGKLSGSLGGLTSDVAKLQRGMDRIKAVGQIAAQFDKTATSVDRLETSVRGTASELAKIARETEQATQAASRYQAQLASEQSALAGNKAALVAARKEQSAYNQLIREGEAAQKSLNAVRSQRAGGNVATAGVGKDIGAPNTSARASMGAFVAADLAANRAAQAKVNAEIKNYERAVEGSSAAIKEMRPQAAAAAAQQTRLAEATDKTSASLRRQREDLNIQRTELGNIGGAVKIASTAMGGMVVTQEAVAQSAERMAANLAKAKAQIATLSETKAPVAAGQDITTGTAKENAARREAVQRLRELRAELSASQADAQRLNAAMRSTAQPTEAMGAAAGKAQQTVRNLKAELGELTNRLRTSSGGFKEFEQRVREIQGAASSASAGNARIAASAQQAGAAQRVIAPQIRQTGAAMGTAANQTNSFNGALLGLGNGTRQSLSLMQRLRGEILSLTAGYLGFQAAIGNIGGALTAYQKLEATQSRLGAVFKQDTASVSREIDFLRAQSDRLGISFGVLADEYGKFTVAASSANFTTDETRKVFLSVAEAGRVNKLSMEQMSGVFLALTQMISKGKVSSEELRRQLGDRLTGAFNIFADAIGVSTAELDEMMRKGEVIADRSTLLKFADELSKRFGPQLSSSLDTVTADLGRFENSVFTAQLALAQGFIPGLRDALQSFNEFSNSTEGRLFFTELGVSIGKFISALAEVPKYFDAIKLVIQGLIAVKLAGFLLETVRRVGEVRASMVGLSQSMAFVGPQMQQMSMAQRVLGQGFAQVVGRIDAYRGTLLASTASTGAARIGTIAFAGSLGVVRTAMIVTAGAARALWAAFGGLPGLIAVGITLAVGSWLTGVSKATTALTEHQRQIEMVKNAYNAAGGKLDDWAKTIKGLTLTEAEGNLRDLTDAYVSKVRQLQDQAIELRTIYERLNSPLGANERAILPAGYADGATGIIELLDKLQSGKVTVAEFREQLDQLAQTTASEEIKEAAKDLLEYTRQTDEGGESLTALSDAMLVQKDIVDGLKGDISALNQATGENKEETEKSVQTFDNAASAASRYAEAIETLRGKIPGLSDEISRMKDMVELTAASWKGLVAAFQMGDFSKIAEVAGMFGQGMNSANNAFFGGAGGGSAAAMIKQFEGYKTEAYYDVNAYRVGYGSDTVTLSDGSIRQVVQGMTTTFADAERDLARRIGEFQDTVKREVGADRFDAMDPQQQGVLTSLAYNYGNLTSTGALDTFKTGTVEEIAQAIRDLATQNEGVNASRRNQEAAIFEGAGTPYALEQNAFETDEEANKKTEERIKDAEFAVDQQELLNAGKGREAAIEEAIKEARAENKTLTEEQIAQISLLAGQEFDLKNIKTEQKTEIQAANEALTLANALAAQRAELEKQFKEAQASGDQDQVLNVQNQLVGVNTELAAAIEKARAMWQAIGGPQADVALTKLDTLALKTSNAKSQMGMFGLSMQQWGSVAGSFADGIVGVFDNFAKAIANGEDAIGALGKAFLEFAANFLREIAMMILKQMLLNALQSFFPGLPIGHTGGVVGSKAIGGGNGRIGQSAPWVKSALTYHTGGLAGLKPDEVNATLRVGEEVLTEEDPRHRNNLTKEQGEGAASGGGQQALKQVLVLDPRELSSAMASKHGESVIMTVIKANRTTLRQILG